MLEFKKAVRQSLPMLLSIAGVSGAGKTFSALLLAAGLAGKDGRVGLIDTENGRGQMYADSPGIMAAFPNGYEYLRMDPPFSPARYTEHLQAAETAGITVCIVDSGSHEWEGIGGCSDIADSKPIKGEPNWKIAKKPHKIFVNYALASSMHVIFCLRAREKVAYIKNAAKGNKVEVVPMGIQPIAEKSFIFEMLVSLMVDEQTHCAKPVKVPEPLAHLFPGTTLIDREMGERILEWNEDAPAADPRELLKKRARLASTKGKAEYKEFYDGLSTGEKKFLRETIHEECKMDADNAGETEENGEDL